VKIEIYAEDDEVDTIVKTLIIVGRAGKMGDGKIAVSNVEELIRIRTGEKNREALY
jgi:nitrogen regulatory protein P-II 1